MIDPGDATGFVSVSEVIPDILLDIRYYSAYNFTGERVCGYEEPIALLTKEAAQALKEVSEDLRIQGYLLKIYDAYRPQSAVDRFVRWAESTDTSMQAYFYPELNKQELFPKGFISTRSSHTRGSTVDLTLVNIYTGQDADMGSTFDYFGTCSHYAYPDITEKQKENRRILREAMVRHGFRPLEEEWWHYTLADEPYPDTYFTFPVSQVSLQRKTENAELTVLCLLEHDGKILVQNRVKKDWHGYALPGGHAEAGESFVDAVIREVQEETGLTIKDPRLAGVKQFPIKDGRYIVFLFKATQYEGTLVSSEEGEMRWVTYEELKRLPTVDDLEELLDVINDPSLSEFQYIVKGDDWFVSLK